MIRVLLSVVLMPALAQAMQVADRNRPHEWSSGIGGSSVEVPVKGSAVKVRLKTINADVEIVSGPAHKVGVRVIDGSTRNVTIRPEGADRLEVLFDGEPALRCGKVCLSLPSRADVDLSTASGDVAVRGVGGEVRLNTVSGDVRASGMGSLEVHSVSGDVSVEDVPRARIHTVSGDVEVRAAASGAQRLTLRSTSGDLSLTGMCGPSCKIEAHSLSGDVRLNLTPRSSFSVHYLSRSGEASDEFDLHLSSGTRAQHGRGDGLIEVQTWSGDLLIANAR